MQPSNISCQLPLFLLRSNTALHPHFKMNIIFLVTSTAVIIIGAILLVIIFNFVDRHCKKISSVGDEIDRAPSNGHSNRDTSSVSAVAGNERNFFVLSESLCFSFPTISYCALASILPLTLKQLKFTSLTAYITTSLSF